MTFTVGDGPVGGDVWTTQQLRGVIDVEWVPDRFTVCTFVDGVENPRVQKRGLARLRERPHRTLVGATVPASAITGIEVALEYPTRSADQAEQAHIAAHGHGWPMTARLHVAFAVENYECEVVVDFHTPTEADERAIWGMCEQIVDERYRDAEVTEPALVDGQLVRRRITSPPPLPVEDHPASPPRHHRRTLAMAVPAAVPVALGEPTGGSLAAEGLGERLFGDGGG